ncbi:hypothetical protein CLOM_g11639 [Closterium sp. NIES-68]|nr:hypothetical protein CLOM_g11639 [Closterium sp. NIES-68]
MEREGYPLYAAEDCPFISRTFNCLENGRTDFDYLHFAWRESECTQPFIRFRADRFFEAFQNRRIVFVGDSILLSMFQSLLCLLSVGPSLPPNHSLPTERLNRTFPSLLHPPSSPSSHLSSSSSSLPLSSPHSSASPSSSTTSSTPPSSSSSSSPSSSLADSKFPSPAPLIFQYTFPHANTSLDFFHSDFLTVLEAAPSHTPDPDIPDSLISEFQSKSANDSSTDTRSIVTKSGSNASIGNGSSLSTSISGTSQEPGSDGSDAVKPGSGRSSSLQSGSEGWEW